MGLFACTNLLNGDWQLVWVTNADSSLHCAEWVDPESDAAANRMRFYVTANSGAALDTDHDGLPDGWEISNFGALSQEAEDDFDDDGFTNLQEYQRGTNPADSDNGKVVLHVDPVNGNDSNNGITAPFATIRAAIAAALNGDTVQVGDGNYPELPATYDVQTKNVKLMLNSSATVR